MGVDWEDCEAVGKVIGTKTVINEFVAYELLGKFKEANVISVRDLRKKITQIILNQLFYFSFVHQQLQHMQFVASQIPVLLEL